MQKTRSDGFSLIEIAISMLMIAIAALGLVRWQAATMHATRQVVATAHAMRFASELAEWMRLLPEEFSRHLNTNLLDAFLRPSIQPVISCFDAECDTEQQIEFYLFEWYRRLQNELPGARVVVCRDDQSEGTLMHTWQCAVSNRLTAPWVIKIGWHRAASAESLPLLVLAAGTISP